MTLHQLKFKTARLRLREFQVDDWPAVLAYQSDPRYLRFYPWEGRSAEEVQQFVQMFIDWAQAEPRCKFQLAIVLPAEEKLIGTCGLRLRTERASEAELGYEIAPAYWGRGYASEAAQRMLTFGFKTLKLHRVWASCLADNGASARVLAKLGLRQEGRLRANRWMKERWRDTLLYGLLAQEWKLQQAGKPLKT